MQKSFIKINNQRNDRIWKKNLKVKYRCLLMLRLKANKC